MVNYKLKGVETNRRCAKVSTSVEYTRQLCIGHNHSATPAVVKVKKIYSNGSIQGDFTNVTSNRNNEVD